MRHGRVLIPFVWERNITNHLALMVEARSDGGSTAGNWFWHAPAAGQAQQEIMDAAVSSKNPLSIPTQSFPQVDAGCGRF